MEASAINYPGQRMFPEPPDTDIRERGQTAGPSLIRTCLSLPSWWPTPPPHYPGPLAQVFSFNPHHHNIRQVLSLAPSERGENRLKEGSNSSSVCRGEGVKLARSLTHVVGPGKGMRRINSSPKSHVHSLPGNLELPDSQRSQTSAVGTQPSEAIGGRVLPSTQS